MGEKKTDLTTIKCTSTYTQQNVYLHTKKTAFCSLAITIRSFVGDKDNTQS